MKGSGEWTTEENSVGQVRENFSVIEPFQRICLGNYSMGQLLGLYVVYCWGTKINNNQNMKDTQSNTEV